jgi:hypothetical protein
MNHYWLKKVLPFLKLPGPVEMDETVIGGARLNCF